MDRKVTDLQIDIIITIAIVGVITNKLGKKGVVFLKMITRFRNSIPVVENNICLLDMLSPTGADLVKHQLWRDWRTKPCEDL